MSGYQHNSTCETAPFHVWVAELLDAAKVTPEGAAPKWTAA